MDLQLKTFLNIEAVLIDCFLYMKIITVDFFDY